MTVPPGLSARSLSADAVSLGSRTFGVSVVVCECDRVVYANVGGPYPGPIFDGISRPVNKVLQLVVPMVSRVENVLDIVSHASILLNDGIGRRARLPRREMVRVVPFQQ